MRILIIDNEPSIRELLADMIEAVTPATHIMAMADGVQSGLEQIAVFKPEIVLLDVEMDDGTGFDLMRQVGNPSFQLIFTTAHNKYAIQAFKCSAIDYLLKPVDMQELSNALQRAAAQINNTSLQQQLAVLMQELHVKDAAERQLVLKGSEASYFVRIGDILYCEAEGSYTRFYLTDEKPILVSKNLSVFEEILLPLGFIRTHHSYLVNIRKIKLYDRTAGEQLVLVNGEKVPVSHRKKEFVLNSLERGLLK